MSTYGCVPVNGYGMYLDMNEISSFLEKMSDVDDQELDSPYDLYDCDLPVVILDEEEMWAGWRLRFYGKDGWHDWYSYADDHGNGLLGVFFRAEKRGDVFAGSDQLYSSPDELVEEMRDAYGECLPDGFDYLSHIAFLSGCRMTCDW